MITLTEENYLKNILVLSTEKGYVPVNVLSQELNIKMPTVNSMMKRLADKELVYFEPYKPIRLTEKGKTEAALILRRHRLTETFLFEKMGLGWEHVHPIAEQIEHIQSALFFDKMDEMLNFPKTDPHGEPIPTKEGIFLPPSQTRLSEHKAGETVYFTAVNDSSEEFLKFLNNKNLKLGTAIKIESIELYDGSFTIAYENRHEILSKIVADKILVE
jgi:Mn-dependent transcriptional regulator